MLDLLMIYTLALWLREAHLTGTLIRALQIIRTLCLFSGLGPDVT